MGLKFNPFTGTLDFVGASGGGGGGDVFGPGSSTDNAIVRFDGTSGTAIQDSAVSIDDLGNLSTTGTIQGSNLPAALTSNRALASSIAGAVTVSITTDTELGYISGVTSAIQTQLNGKLNLGTNVKYVGANQQYTTIQAALTAIGNAASAADVKKPQTVIIEGGIYDEALTIPQGRILTLVAQGTVILGNGAGTNFGSTTPRAITATFNNADVFGSDIKPALNIIAIPGSDATSTFIAEAGCFFISGALNVTGDGLSHTVNLSNVKLSGIINKTAAGLTNLQAYRSYFIGAINMGTATILERAYDCEFDALVTVDGYNALINCEVNAGMTVTTNFNTLPPSGFFFTTFFGTFTGPANSVKLDPVSDYFFITNGATLAGGATKVLISSIPAVNVKYVPADSGDWTSPPTIVSSALDELADRLFNTGDYNVEKFTLNGTDITNGYVTLADTPTTANLTRLIVIGGAEQDYSIDFTMIGTQLSWDTLVLDGVLVSGDKIIAVYN